jgi:hypothetical protein
LIYSIWHFKPIEIYYLILPARCVGDIIGLHELVQITPHLNRCGLSHKTAHLHETWYYRVCDELRSGIDNFWILRFRGIGSLVENE